MPLPVVDKVNKKFVTAEYHDGQEAYKRGQPLTSNPYLDDPTVGRLWYWVWGWQDAMADDVRDVKRLLLTMVQPTDTGKAH